MKLLTAIDKIKNLDPEMRRKYFDYVHYNLKLWKAAPKHRGKPAGVVYYKDQKWFVYYLNEYNGGDSGIDNRENIPVEMVENALHDLIFQKLRGNSDDILKRCSIYGDIVGGKKRLSELRKTYHYV